MKSNIFIPKTINVGFQDRNDTYTGKLAYVIYYDEKGKLRKEASWNNWRDDKIPNEEFDNIPTSGFVLNKKVGDYDNGWNHRHAYTRIYDPRNFEFEISIENLLYILENVNSIKGKGLEGEFVYGWDGTELVLIPVESSDYKELVTYNSIVHNCEKIKARDLIIGASYLTKENNEIVYMGKFDYYNWDNKKEDKRFVFCVNADKPDKYGFTFLRNINSKLIKCTDGTCKDTYSNMFDQLEGKKEYSPIDDKKDEYILYSFDEFKRYVSFTEERFGRLYYPFDDYLTYPDEGMLESYEYRVYMNDETCLYRVCVCRGHNQSDYDYFSRFRFNEIEKKGYWCNVRKEKEFIDTTLEELYERIKPCYRNKYLKNGRLYRKDCYYGDKE